MQLVRYNPWRDLSQLERDMEKIFGEGWDWASTPATQGPATIDMYTEDNKLVIEATLSGFKKEEVRVATTDNMLDIAAEHTEKEKPQTTRDYLMHESSHSYHRRVSLPEGIDIDKAVADFSDGRLVIVIPIGKHVVTRDVTIK